MATAYPRDADIEKLLPECPADVTDAVVKKQYAIYRKAMIDAIRSTRQMLYPLNEQGATRILAGLRTSLLQFLSVKLGRDVVPSKVIRTQPLGKPKVISPALPNLPTALVKSKPTENE